jgi:hypothetical protein
MEKSKSSAKETRLDESCFEVSKCGKTRAGLGPSGAASAKPARDFESILDFVTDDWDSATKAASLGMDQKEAGTSLGGQKQQELLSKTWHSGTTSTALQTKKSSNKIGRCQSAIFSSGAIMGSSSILQYNLDEWNSDSDLDMEDEA